MVTIVSALIVFAYAVCVSEVDCVFVILHEALHMRNRYHEYVYIKETKDKMCGSCTQRIRFRSFIQ